MSEFYIASFSLDDNCLCHYGVKGMKWGQHIFGKEPNGRYTKKKQTKMIKKYGPQKARLKEAKSVRKSYMAARYSDKKMKYADSDRAEYQDAIGKIVDAGTWDPKLVMDISNIRKKERKLFNDYIKVRDRTFSDNTNDKLKKEMNKIYEEYDKVSNERLEKTKEWTEQVFGTKPTDLSVKEVENTGMVFLNTLPQSFFDEYETMYNDIRRLIK